MGIVSGFVETVPSFFVVVVDGDDGTVEGALNTDINLGFDDLIIPSTRKNRQLLNEAVAAVVKNAHSDHSQSKASSEKKKCLLELLFDAEDTEHSGRSSGNPSLSYKELQAETKTFLVAGKSLKVLIILSLRLKTHNTFLSRA